MLSPGIFRTIRTLIVAVSANCRWELRRPDHWNNRVRPSDGCEAMRRTRASSGMIVLAVCTMASAVRAPYAYSAFAREAPSGHARHI